MTELHFLRKSTAKIMSKFKFLEKRSWNKLGFSKVDSRVFTISFIISYSTVTNTAKNLCLGSKTYTLLHTVSCSVVDADSLNPDTDPDPAFQANPYPVPEKNTAEICFVF
jgi:hypothetical protein